MSIEETWLKDGLAFGAASSFFPRRGDDELDGTVASASSNVVDSGDCKVLVLSELDEDSIEAASEAETTVFAVHDDSSFIST